MILIVELCAKCKHVSDTLSRHTELASVSNWNPQCSHVRSMPCSAVTSLLLYSWVSFKTRRNSLVSCRYVLTLKKRLIRLHQRKTVSAPSIDRKYLLWKLLQSYCLWLFFSFTYCAVSSSAPTHLVKSLVASIAHVFKTFKRTWIVFNPKQNNVAPSISNIC